MASNGLRAQWTNCRSGIRSGPNSLIFRGFWGRENCSAPNLPSPSSERQTTKRRQTRLLHPCSLRASQLIVQKVWIVRADPARLEDNPKEHDRPEDDQRGRKQKGKDPGVRAPPEKPAVSPEAKISNVPSADTHSEMQTTGSWAVAGKFKKRSRSPMRHLTDPNPIRSERPAKCHCDVRFPARSG
jgi:hypothetical protein